MLARWYVGGTRAPLAWPDDVLAAAAETVVADDRPLPMTRALSRALENRVRSDGSRPLVTWYDLGQGQRTELSARTFANWVDKTVNLMASVGLVERPQVGLPLLLAHPGHWVGLVWTMAVWQIGGQVQAEPRETLDAVDLAVVGPENSHPVPGVETVACSLHPLGLGFATPRRAVIDYAEVTSHPDGHWAYPAQDTSVAFTSNRTLLTAGEIDQVAGSSERRALRVAASDDPWRVLAEALVAPILGGGSIVVVSGDTGDGVERVLSSENAALIPPDRR